MARVPRGFACWEGRRKGLEKITCVSVLLSSGLQLGIWFCSRNFGSRPRSCYRTPNRSKGEALGIPIPGRDPGPAQPQRGPLSACSPACLSVSLTLRDQKEQGSQSHTIWFSNCVPALCVSSDKCLFILEPQFPSVKSSLKTSHILLHLFRTNLGGSSIIIIITILFYGGGN